MRGQDMDYGESAAYEQQQKMAPLGIQVEPMHLFNASRTSTSTRRILTNRNTKRTYHARSTYWRRGGPSRDMSDNVDILLSAMYAVNPDPIIAELINNRMP